MNNDFDVIVIGSGAGGLTAAVALARAGRRVLVCEQHYVPGGWCHSFTLEGHTFSPGVHYVGELAPGQSLRRIYEGLGVSRDLAFCELNPDGFDHVLVGDSRFDIPKGRARYIERLKQRFVREAAGIDRFFALVEELAGDLRRVARLRGPLDVARLPFVAPTLMRWGWRFAGDLIAHCVGDPLLRAILGSQAGDHGLPPSRVPAVVHASIVHHYLDGGYYPLGGGFAIARAFVRALKRAGGTIRLRTPVQRILLEGRRAIGVQLVGGEQLRADVVVSNADPAMTFGRLIGDAHLPRRLRRRLGRLRYSCSALSLFVATDMDLRRAGLDSGNFWLYDHSDLDAIYRQLLDGEVVRSGRVPGLFLTATTLKDPSKRLRGNHTLEAFALTSYEPFTRWADQPHGERDADYQALKEQLTGRLLDRVEQLLPGLRQRLTFCALGTPLSNAHFLAANRGNIYGIDKDRLQVGPLSLPIRTPFEGLYMVGASTFSHGVAGVTASGIAAARAIIGCGTRELLGAAGPELQIYPAEDPSVWPDRLRERVARGAVARGG